MSMFTKSLSPSMIWNYVKRGLSVKILYEDTSNTQVMYRHKEYFDQGWELIGKIMGSGSGGIYTEDDDLLNNASQTILLTGYDPTPIRDHDDNTWDSASYSITSASSGATTTTTDIVEYDLGDTMTVMIYVKGQTDNPESGVVAYPTIYVSNDGSTWSEAVKITSNEEVTVKATARYIKYSIVATNSSVTTNKTYTDRTLLSSLEVYRANDLDVSYSKIFDSSGFKMVSMLYDGSSTVYGILYKVRELP